MQTIHAANFTPVTSRSIDLMVIHDMEFPERMTAAEDVAHFFQNQRRGSSGSSAHYNIDNNSVVRSVEDHNVAWAAPGANHDGLHFEHAGYARQSEADWLDSYSKKMLDEQSAPLVATKCRQHNIPPIFLHAPALVAQKRGITTHWEITKAFSHGFGHTDPGSHFPIERYISKIQQLLGVKASDAPHEGRPVKKSQPTLKLGATGFQVKMMQRLLNYEEKRAWDDIKVDGHFGERTQAELKEFQKRAGLRSDGVCGPNTWTALWVARYQGNL